MMSEPYGRYETIQEIGRGAMGTVFRARDPQIDRLVALKALQVPQGTSEEEKRELEQRFEREARTVGKLVHPNIVQIYDSGPGFIAMELVEGLSLDRLMTQAPPSLPLALSILDQIAAALDYAHAFGIIHRDVKPGNIIVNPAGVAKVMDFGIAKVLGATLLTARVMGTPRYMAPEQVEGAPATAASDNFALAEIAYELLAGRQAFPGETVASVLYHIVHEDPPPASLVNRALPRAVDPVFARALAKNPAHRYLHGRDMVADLRGAIAGGPTVQSETQSGAVLAAPRRAVYAALRVVLVPPAVILAAIGSLLLLSEDARMVARDYLAPTEDAVAVVAPQQGKMLETSARPQIPAAPTGSPAPKAIVEPPQAAPVAARTEVPATAVPAVLRPTQMPMAVPAPPVVTPTTPPMAMPPSATMPPKKGVPPTMPPPEHPAHSVTLYGLRFFSRPAPLMPGALVASVEPGSPATRAGLRPKDIVTRWNGMTILGPMDLEGQERSPSRRFAIEYQREEDGGLQTRQTTLSVGEVGAAPQIAIASVRLEHNARNGGEKGINVRTSLEANAYRVRHLTLHVRVEELSGETWAPLRGAAGAPLDYKLAVSPDADTWVSDALPIFIPYGDLPASSGEHTMRLYLQVSDEEGRALASYASMPFLLTSGTPP